SFYASADTVYELPAVDHVVEDVASGLAWTQYALSTGAYHPHTAGITLLAGVHLLSYRSQDNVGNLEVAKSTTVLVDDAYPITTITIGAPLYTDVGVKYIAPQTPIDFAAADPDITGTAAGSGVDRIEISVDGGSFEISSGTLKLAEGRHTVQARAVDRVGNTEPTRTLEVRVDDSKPVSSLNIGIPAYTLPDGTVLVGGQTQFAIASQDPVVRDVASGVSGTSFRVIQGTAPAPPYTAYAGTFTLSGIDEPKTIEFFATDNVGNIEVVRSSTVLLDASAPLVALISPSPDAQGIARIFTYKFPVIGTVQDAHLRDYYLEGAPGSDAQTGFVMISSGTDGIENDVLGVWDVAALTGFYTLRLRATDLVDNLYAVSMDVFIGEPARQLVLGGRRTFNHPEGVAAGPEDRIYVADTNNDRIRVFESSGSWLANFGEKCHGDDDDDDQHCTGLNLNKPKDLAVDAAGNTYVADTHHHRIVKLSPEGDELMDIGDVRIDKKGKKKFHSGKELGELKHPSGVALDATGNIYVADSGNRRVQVFDPQGGYLRGFTLPPVPDKHGDDDDDDDEDDGEAGLPVGIDVDAANDIFVADRKSRQVFKFNPKGEVLLAIHPEDLEVNKPHRHRHRHYCRHDKLRDWLPIGVAVSATGSFLVSDQDGHRIWKFDSLGNLTLVFGEKGKIKDSKPLPEGIVFDKPAGLALDSQGRLLVADRNNERIQRFGLPQGAVLLASAGSGLIVQEQIDKDKGGEVRREDDAAVIIPPAALHEDTEIFIAEPEENEKEEKMQQLVMAGKKMGAASDPVEYGPHGLEFKKPVQLTIPYDPDKLAADGGENLSIHYWNPESKEWEELESTVDKGKKTVSAKTKHFSLYQVLAPQTQLAASEEFVLRDVYVFPDPAVRGAQPTFHVEVGIADSVQITIYNIAGQEAHRTTLTGSPKVVNDGSGADYAYEYKWNGHIPSGVYLYTISAEKAGHGPLRKAGRFAVVR
ncbi:MAG: hypothetical protein ABIJ61_08360, partial [bacterium]